MSSRGHENRAQSRQDGRSTASSCRTNLKADVPASEMSEWEVADEFSGQLLNDAFGATGRENRNLGGRWHKAPTEMVLESGRLPSRLCGPVGGGRDPYHNGSTVGTAIRSADDAFACAEGTCKDSVANSDNLLMFQHLAALEEAASSGAAFRGHIPHLPCAAASAAHTVEGARFSSPRTARGREYGCRFRDAGSTLLQTRCPPSLPHKLDSARNADAQRKHALYVGETMPFAFQHSALRGGALPRGRYGPAATNQWLGMESARLRAEAAKSVGRSAAFAFLQNGGPESMDPIGAALCQTQLLP
eukprot:TRINITY_DN49048_c0_g1_i1.p1 TRINITY_DN49048_c0_g1~~TRINITY_DN49048_c0_g1_i1.p1  ORF type:complete len:303 (+),score=34.66 TRINITY_DN49048_c0_g1_i1:91-999(+)